MAQNNNYHVFSGAKTKIFPGHFWSFDSRKLQTKIWSVFFAKQVQKKKLKFASIEMHKIISKW